MEATIEERGDGRHVLVVTLNADNLHERAGSRNVIHMFGELLKSRCEACLRVSQWDKDMFTSTPCPSCGRAGAMRPHLVFFGELAFDTDRIYAALRTCDLFLSIGTSSSIYPAAGFIEEVRLAGQAHTVELNLEPSIDVDLFAEQRLGLATKVVPAYVEQILAEI